MLIPAGTFQMGGADEDARADEQPVHTVHLDAFYMDKCEVTNAQFKAFVDANPPWQKDLIMDEFHDGDYLKHWDGNTYPYGKANHPVVWISWYAALVYAEWAGGKQLPTEAEWEYAARGGLAGKKYPSGKNTISTREANYDNHVGDTTPVADYAANGYRLNDMVGNVFEWCLDAYDADFYAKSRNSRNPISSARTTQGLTPPTCCAAARGADDALYMRVAHRDWGTPTGTDGNTGFRCVRAVPR